MGSVWQRFGELVRKISKDVGYLWGDLSSVKFDVSSICGEHFMMIVCEKVPWNLQGLKKVYNIES